MLSVGNISSNLAQSSIFLKENKHFSHHFEAGASPNLIFSLSIVTVQHSLLSLNLYKDIHIDQLVFVLMEKIKSILRLLPKLEVRGGDRKKSLARKKVEEVREEF